MNDSGHFRNGVIPIESALSALSIEQFDQFRCNDTANFPNIFHFQISSKALVSAYIARIKEVNSLLNAVVHENFIKAIEEAEKVDDYLQKIGKNSEEFLQVNY